MSEHVCMCMFKSDKVHGWGLFPSLSQYILLVRLLVIPKSVMSNHCFGSHSYCLKFATATLLSDVTVVVHTLELCTHSQFFTANFLNDYCNSLITVVVFFF